MKKIILFGMMFFSLNSFSFEDAGCLKADFSTSVKKSIDPFGYFHEVLMVKKNKCNITIELTKAKYINSKWRIDICREPIHIKYGKNLQNVVRKISDEYDQIYSEIKNVIENNGLIYGEGIRENLSSQHGMVYCSYLLINQYLNNSIVFSYEKPLEIVLNGPTFLNDLRQNKGQTNTAPVELDKGVKQVHASEQLYNF